jgi:hypothetical protein
MKTNKHTNIGIRLSKTAADLLSQNRHKKEENTEIKGEISEQTEREL